MSKAPKPQSLLSAVFCGSALLFLTAAHPAVAENDRSFLSVLTAVCGLDPSDVSGLRRLFPGGRLMEARLDGLAGQPFRARHRVLVSDGEWTFSRVMPGGRLRRFSLEWREASGSGQVLDLRPVLAVSASGDCRATEGRRLVYGDGDRPEGLEVLSADLATVVLTEPLNPPVPEGKASPGGAVRVALIDTGVNYTLPVFQGRLARGPQGNLIGYDFWDMDARPFDIDTARSPFFPLHHGTAVASIILREAPKAVIMPYRFPRPDMSRFEDLIVRADADGAVIVNMAMGSDKIDDWDAFARAAAARPHMLFILSAGNNGRDIDAKPVFPAALELDNLLTVTSADAGGRLARGSNWGATHVDVMVPGEQIAVTDHRGAAGKASGSSFAVPRVTALAARLLAKHPEWQGPQVKAAILKRARKPFGGGVPLRHGWIPDPKDDFEG